MNQTTSEVSSSRPTVAVVDLEAVRANVRLVREKIGPGRTIMAVVKSDAYGHGVIPVARACLDAGAMALGVATTDEALCLRETKGFRDLSIMVMGPTLESEVEALQNAELDFSVGGNDLLKAHLEYARRRGKPARIHVQIDTGISRDGFRHDDFSFLNEFHGAEGCLRGIWTHFAAADSVAAEDVEFTELQCHRLEEAVKQTKGAGFSPIVHAANSGAVLRHPRAHYDLVRPGLMLYGLEPSGDETLTPQLRQALTLKSRIATIKTMQPGDTISYGRRFTIPSERPIGVIPLGYGDGMHRLLWAGAEVVVRGKRAPIRGVICMDQFMIDLSEVPEAETGDEVVIYGCQNDAGIPIEEAARIAQTIPYELTCALTPRVPRVYRQK